jgi:RimJ/RimL family protein N-acetyltransferase
MAQQVPTNVNATAMVNQPVGDIVYDWTPRANPASNPEYQVLRGQYCRLELLTSATSNIRIQQLYDAFKPTEQTHFTYLDYGPFETVDQLTQFLHTLQQPSSNTVVYIIIVNELAVGFITYLRIDEKNGMIEIGHVNFSQQLTRTQQATEASFLLMQYAFDILGYRRVEWTCNPLNKKSYRAALRLGFQYEGTWLKLAVCKGRSADMAWFSIVDDEWLQVKYEIQRWLNASNFDVNGQQLSRLNSAQANPRSSKSLTSIDGKNHFSS